MNKTNDLIEEYICECELSYDRISDPIEQKEIMENIAHNLAEKLFNDNELGDEGFEAVSEAIAKAIDLNADWDEILNNEEERMAEARAWTEAILGY